jgi:mRNA interferase MazF
VKGYPFEVAVPEGQGVIGVILADHIKSVDWRARRAEYIGRLPAPTVEDTIEKATTLLR